MSTDPFLIAASISKRFGITQALDAVSVSFRRGEVHALVGENGAGKSTLGKVIAGLHAQDAGTVSIDGQALRPGSIEEAFHAGVRLVHQELAQCPSLTVAENLSLHDLPTRRGFVDGKRMIERAARLVHRLDPGIDVTAQLGSLPPGRRQIVQIAASLDDRTDARRTGGAAKVIVLDEPTSSLSLVESERLMEIARELAEQGLTIIYVSHRMAEIFAICHRVSVLRDGRLVATSDVKDIDEHTLMEQMIGRTLEATTRRPRSPSGAEARAALEVLRMSSPRRLQEISLKVQPGEIVGLGGLVGCGRSELLDAIFGLDPASTGEVRVCGGAIARHDSNASIRAGMGYVPEDRQLQGLFSQLDVGLNILIPFVKTVAAAFGMRRPLAERAIIANKMRSFQVKAAASTSLPGELSGGNQQKLLIARWMGGRTKVLLLDEPTRGIDVGTKLEIYKRIQSAAEAGAAVLLASSEMPELLALSDRLLVMCGGRISGELTGDAMTQANVLRLATQDSRAASSAA